jgi:hypothetical protein
LSAIRKPGQPIIRSVPRPLPAEALFNTEHTMSQFRFLIAAARVLAVLAAVGLFIQVGPSLASHATSHAATYQVRSH